MWGNGLRLYLGSQRVVSMKPSLDACNRWRVRAPGRAVSDEKQFPTGTALRFLLILAAVLPGTPVAASHDARAQSGGSYDVHWNAAASGGGAAAGPGGYSITGTVAAPGATPSSHAGGTGGYILRGGLWSGIHEANDTIFRNDFEQRT